MAIVQTFNKVFSPVFTTKARYIHLWGGRGRGGSHTATDYFLHKQTQPHYFRGYFMRAVFGDVRDLLWRDYKDRFNDKDTITINEFNLKQNPKVSEKQIMWNLIN